MISKNELIEYWFQSSLSCEDAYTYFLLFQESLYSELKSMEIYSLIYTLSVDNLFVNDLIINTEYYLYFPFRFTDTLIDYYYGCEDRPLDYVLKSNLIANKIECGKYHFVLPILETFTKLEGQKDRSLFCDLASNILSVLTWKRLIWTNEIIHYNDGKSSASTHLTWQQRCFLHAGVPEHKKVDDVLLNFFLFSDSMYCMHYEDDSLRFKAQALFDNYIKPLPAVDGGLIAECIAVLYRKPTHREIH